MKSALARWLMPALRYGLCVVAIVYLVTHVPWHDRVRLGGAEGPQVRLIEQQGDHFVIERDGQRQTVAASGVHYVDVGGQRIPDVELGIPSVVFEVDVSLATFAILLFLAVTLIHSHRLVLMVAIQGVRLTYWTATKLTFAGNFFNFALPGTTGGDLIKAYYITRYTHLKTEVVTTVFLDRAIGLFGLVVLAAVSILITWDYDRFGHLMLALGVIFLGLAVGSIVVFSQRLRRALRLTQLIERLPLGEQLLRIGRATVALRHNKGFVALALLETMILQSICMVSATLMAWALGMKGGLAYYFIYVSIGFLIAAIPISPPQAIGVMEAAYVQFFTRDGLNTASQAVALALAVRLIQLVWAVPGILVPLMGAHLPRKAELDALETENEAPPAAKPSVSAPQ